MTQFAIIKKLTAPDKAEVEVLRGTACGDDCGSCEVCHYASKIRVEAKNEIVAQLGGLRRRPADSGHSRAQAQKESHHLRHNQRSRTRGGVI